MTNDEAARLAHKWFEDNAVDYDGAKLVSLVNFEREIENAAFERAASVPIDLAQRWRATLAAERHLWSLDQIKMFKSAIEGVEAVATAIRALIQPPAHTRDSQEMGVYFQPPVEGVESTAIFNTPAQQKENGE